MTLPTIKKDILLVDLTLYLRKHKTLIIPDVHIGYEEALNKQGILVPRFQFNDIIKRVEGIFLLLRKEKLPIERIVLIGDVKHEFGAISDEEWRNTLKFLDFLQKESPDMILIKGNHDTMLGPIANRRNLKLVDSVDLREVFICHGDKIHRIPPTAKTIIIGHEHPAASIGDGIRSEVFKCFLKGTWKSRPAGKLLKRKLDLIVMPSLNLVTEGTDVLKEELLSPFLQENLDAFEVFVVAQPGEILYFKKIKDLRMK
ncbi:metallophosphoesterase [Candidatus Woesearchaeota archaeon]|nr:metallophosphoesterase [Candidatus Woesearchaeota archaeon]